MRESRAKAGRFCDLRYWFTCSKIAFSKALIELDEVVFDAEDSGDLVTAGCWVGLICSNSMKELHPAIPPAREIIPNKVKVNRFCIFTIAIETRDWINRKHFGPNFSNFCQNMPPNASFLQIDFCCIPFLQSTNPSLRNQLIDGRMERWRDGGTPRWREEENICWLFFPFPPAPLLLAP